MNIVINAVLGFEKPRGVGRYINNLLPALADLDKKNQYYIYYGKWMQEYEFLKIKQDNFHFIELDIKNTQIIRNLYLAIALPILCRRYEPDLLFLIDTQAILLKPCRLVSTIHDLAEFVVPEKYSKKQALIRKCIVKLQVKLSDHIITVSNYSKKDLCTRFALQDHKVSVVYNAVDFKHSNRELSVPNNYFLYVSEIERAKNLIELLEAYSMMPVAYREKFHVKIVGKKGNDYENVMNLVRDKKIESNVIFYGYVSDEELNTLYRKAYAFVFPSVFEGFGLPVLEAMAKGTPVLCSNSSSIPEVGGDAVLTFSPYNSEDLLNQMIRIIEDDNLRMSMIQRGLERAQEFSKEVAAKRTLEILEKGH